MKNIQWGLGLLFLLGVLMGCSRTEKFKAVEGPIETPYDSIGTLEVHLNTSPWKPVNWGWDLKKILTLGFGNTSYQRRLQKELVKKAKKHGDVDQLINVTYWPSPDSKGFPHGRIYARGEMVHYRRFSDAASKNTPHPEL